MAKVTTVSGMYRLLEWIMWIAYLNLLWIGFSIVGLLVFGVFPATVATYTVLRKLLINGQGTPIFKTFFHSFKKDFLKSNAIGFTLVIIGYVLYLDFIFIGSISGPLFYVLQTGLFVVTMVYIVTLLYIFPVYVHFDLKFTRYFKDAILIGIFSPFTTILMVIGLVFVYYLIKFIPGLLPLITVSMVALILMGCSLIAFRRLENKQESLTKTTE